jgi:predicted nucleic acid-binding protein
LRRVFADTQYWVALVLPGDPWRDKAKSVSISLGAAHVITTDEVLTEVLNFVSSAGPRTRQVATGVVRDITRAPNVEVIPQSRESFLEGLDLYERRTDKRYSLTDCISMRVMRKHRLMEVLTHDRHFTQEGFVALLRD